MEKINTPDQFTLELNSIFSEWGKRHPVSELDIVGKDPWKMVFSFVAENGGRIKMRALDHGDESLLSEFGGSLSKESQQLFCPYPWGDKEKLKQALENTISKNLKREDLSFLVLSNSRPVGHFFLWKAGGNAHSREYGVEIPELGVAISDSLHGQGLGYLSVRLLQAMARKLNRDGIELTTADNNDSGWKIYGKAGFVYLGDINNPLEVDATDVVAGQVIADKYRIERQMFYCINKSKELMSLDYLAHKRGI